MADHATEVLSLFIQHLCNSVWSCEALRVRSDIPHRETRKPALGRDDAFFTAEGCVRDHQRHLAPVQHRHLPARVRVACFFLFSSLRDLLRHLFGAASPPTRTTTRTEFSIVRSNIPGQSPAPFNSPAQSWPASFCRARRSSWRPGTGASTFDRP